MNDNSTSQYLVNQVFQSKKYNEYQIWFGWTDTISKQQDIEYTLFISGFLCQGKSSSNNIN
jgi:hypothetical protein